MYIRPAQGLPSEEVPDFGPTMEYEDGPIMEYEDNIKMVYEG